jgi:hypothetical protein
MDTGHLAQCLYAVIRLPDDTRTESTADHLIQHGAAAAGTDGSSQPDKLVEAQQDPLLMQLLKSGLH